MHPASRIGSYPRRARCPKDYGATSSPPGCAEAWQALLYTGVPGVITLPSVTGDEPGPPCSDAIAGEIWIPMHQSGALPTYRPR